MPAELIVSLDIPDSNTALNILGQLPDEINWFKIGLELFIAEGPSVLNILKQRDKNIFLDLKLHDYMDKCQLKNKSIYLLT